MAIAANEARQLIRRERRRTIVEVGAGPPPTPRDPADAIAVVDLRRVLRQLDPDDQSLLAMRFVGGLDSTQIGEQAGLSASGVRSRLSRLLERLRKDLDDA